MHLDPTNYRLQDFELPKSPEEEYALPKLFVENCPGEKPLSFGSTANVYYSDKLGDDSVDASEAPYLPFLSLLQNSNQSSEPFTLVGQAYRQVLEAVLQVNNGEYGEDEALTTPPNDLPIWQTVIHAVCHGKVTLSAMPEECAKFGYDPKILANATDLAPIDVAQGQLIFNLGFGTEKEQVIIDATKQAVEKIFIESALALKATAQPQPPVANPVPAPASTLATTPEPVRVNGTHTTNITSTAATPSAPVSSRMAVWQPSRLLSGLVANAATQAVSLPLRRLAAARINDPVKRKYAYALIDTISQGVQLGVLYGMDPQRVPGTAMQMAVSTSIAAFASVNVSHTVHAAGRAFGALNAVYAINQAIVKGEPERLAHLLSGLLGNFVSTVAVEALMAKLMSSMGLHNGTDRIYREGFERTVKAPAVHDEAASRTLLFRAGQTCSNVFNHMLRLDAGFGNVLMDYLSGRKVGNLVAQSLQPSKLPLNSQSGVELPRIF